MVASPESVGAEMALNHLAGLEEADDAAIIEFVDAVLQYAVRQGASDVHFEPSEDALIIRYRVDGGLRERSPVAAALIPSVTSRLKILSNLDIAERRVPQDGRIRMEVDGRPVDFRVSTLPTPYGESVVLRVLDRSVRCLKLDAIGLPPDVFERVREVVRRPYGVFVVTGPTGSGKTTTLYSALRELDSDRRKILTIEDPVEFELDGIVQVPVNARAGLDFVSAIRAFLRHDPDTILIGEIRDSETAKAAIQASLTGHLVLTTLHTNDAPAAVTRLIDMEVEPFLVAAALEAVLAQRLVRCICPDCRTEDAPSRECLQLLELSEQTTLYAGVGCSQCMYCGYRGRMGLFEYMAVSELLRERICAAASADELRLIAQSNGMRSLRDDGVRAVLAGLTTASEVIRATG